MEAIREAIRKTTQSQHLTALEAEEAMNDILSGRATQAQIGAFLAALRVKGESAEEILGCARAMRSSARPVRPRRQGCVDTCGTGGDMAGTFNVSTVAAFVVAGAGVPVAKHGNRSISSACGSADVLEALGVHLALAPEQVGYCIDEVGIGFLFAPLLHPAMANAMGARRELGVRTVFNVLGPLTNPASVPFQVVGVFDAGLVRPLATVLSGLGLERALVVHGHGGLDELSTSGLNLVAEAGNGEIREYLLDAQELGIPRGRAEDLRGGDAAVNAAMARSVLLGEKGPCRDTVVLNAAAALYAAGASRTLAEAIPAAEGSIDGGQAMAALDSLVALSRQIAQGSAA